MDIRITDIFNIESIESNKTNKEYIVLDINVDYIEDFLIPINQYNGVFIYKLRKSERLDYEMKKVGLQMNDYIELGHYMIYDTNYIKILLINKNLTKITNKYNSIDIIGNLYVWKPVSMHPGYINLGVVITSDPHEVPSEYIGLVPENHVKIFSNSYSQLFQNDYNLLGCSKDNKKKLYTVGVLENNEDKNEKQFTGNWDIYRSRNLVLSENGDAWFMNKKDTHSKKYINNSNYFSKNKGKRRLREVDTEYDLHFIILVMVILIIMLLGYNFLKKRFVNNSNILM